MDEVQEAHQKWLQGEAQTLQKAREQAGLPLNPTLAGMGAPGTPPAPGPMGPPAAPVAPVAPVPNDAGAPVDRGPVGSRLQANIDLINRALDEEGPMAPAPVAPTAPTAPAAPAAPAAPPPGTAFGRRVQTALQPGVDAAVELGQQQVMAEAQPLIQEAEARDAAARLRRQQSNDQLRMREARLEETRANYKARSEEPLDPDRWQEDMSAVNWISAFIGAIAGGLAGNPEGMQRILQERIKQDIELQRADKDSMLNALAQELGSAEAAQRLYESRFFNALDQEIAAQESLGGLKAETQAKLNGLRQAAQLRAQEQVEQATMFGLQKQLEADLQWQQAQRVASAKGQSVVPTGSGQAELQAELAREGIDWKEYQAYAKEALPVIQGVRELDQFETLLDAAARSNGGDLPGFWGMGWETPGVLKSPEGVKLQQAFDMVVARVLKKQSGAAVTDEERQNVKKMMKGTGTDTAQGIRNGIALQKAPLELQLETVNDAHPGAARAYSNVTRRRVSSSPSAAETQTRLEQQRAQKLKEGLQQGQPTGGQ